MRHQLGLHQHGLRNFLTCPLVNLQARYPSPKTMRRVHQFLAIRPAIEQAQSLYFRQLLRRLQPDAAGLGWEGLRPAAAVFRHVSTQAETRIVLENISNEQPKLKVPN